MYSRPYDQSYLVVDKTSNTGSYPREIKPLKGFGRHNGGIGGYARTNNSGFSKKVELSTGERMGSKTNSLETELRVYSTLEDARDVWCAFETNALAFAYQSFVWAKHWQAVIGEAENYKLHIVHVLNAAGDTLMLVPLCYHKMRFTTGLYYIGEGMSDYLGPLIHPEFASGLTPEGFENLWQQMMETLPAKIDYVWLDRQPSEIISVTNPFHHLQGFEFDSQCHALNYPAAENWHAGARIIRSNKTAKKIERRIRQLTKVGELALIEVTETEARIAHMKELMALKVDNLNDANILHRFDKPDIEEFYTALVADESAQPNLRQFELRCGGKLVASVFGMDRHQTFYYQICAYDRENFGQYSPGLLLMYQLFDWTFERGFKRFDMTIGDEAYKQEWTNQSLPLKTVAYGITPAGKIELAKGQFLRWLKNTIKKSSLLRNLTMKILRK